MRLALAASLGLMGLPATAQDGAPLSAIDWLSQSVESTPSAAEPPVTQDATAPGVTVSPLDESQDGKTGVLPPEVTGLPRDLWVHSDGEALVRLILSEPVETLPALQDLLVTLMLAEAEPPADGSGQSLFLARVDKLLVMGALEAARSLLESEDLLDPGLFRRWFDVTLLTGTEHEACGMLQKHPTLAPTLPARVFCIARNGDWNAAALTLNTARALGDVTSDEEMLLTRFLDPEFGPAEDDLLPPSRPSPLVYRIREAVGDLMPTTGLPLAFSHADLRDTVAWRAQIEAAERLARNGALSENVLLRFYTARDPAASGGVWDRAALIQELDAAISSGDKAAVARSLEPAWVAMREVGLEVPFARLYGTELFELGLEGEAGTIAHRVALLAPAYREAALARVPASRREAVWRAVATGEFEGVTATDAPSAAVVAGFTSAEVPAPLQEAIAEGRIGEAVLEAIAAFQRGLDGDHAAVTAAIATLRAAGLEESARRAVLQYLLLDAPG